MVSDPQYIITTCTQMCNIAQFISYRTAVTLGTSSGLTLLILIILGGICVYDRDKPRKNLEFSKNKGKANSLLDGKEYVKHVILTHISHPTVPWVRREAPTDGSIYLLTRWPP